MHLPGDDTYGNIAVGKIEEIVAEEVGDRFETYISGIFTLVKVMNDYSLSDLKMFLPLAILLNIIILWFVYRTLSTLNPTLSTCASLCTCITCSTLGTLYSTLSPDITLSPCWSNKSFITYSTLSTCRPLCSC